MAVGTAIQLSSRGALTPSRGGSASSRAQVLVRMDAVDPWATERRESGLRFHVMAQLFAVTDLVRIRPLRKRVFLLQYPDASRSEPPATSECLFFLEVVARVAWKVEATVPNIFSDKLSEP